MSLHLIDGLPAGLEGTGLQARLEPEPALCCVKLGPP